MSSRGSGWLLEDKNGPLFTGSLQATFSYQGCIDERPLSDPHCFVHEVSMPQ